MSRMEINTLTSLVESAEAVGYTLPSELLDAHRTYVRVKAVEIPQPKTLEADTAAARIVSAVAAGETPDPSALAHEVNRAALAGRDYDQAKIVMGLAVEQAGNAATNLASDLTEQIIVKHLRPALEQVHREAREVAGALKGYGLDPHTLITAPAKARNAYGSLPTLVARRKGIYRARRWANTIGNREPQHDVMGMFVEFERPLAFHPHWKLPAQIPGVPAPEDETERLIWVVSEAAAIGQPWLPTVEEQDAAWWAQFGKGVETRASKHRDGLAIGARIGA